MDEVGFLLSDFLENLDYYWCGNRRQVKKTSNRVSKINDFYGWSKDELVFFSLSAAKNRIYNNYQTVYISSYGSSGSHLLQSIMSEAKRSIPLGEVYIAPNIINKVQDLSDSDKNKFMEAYHLIHCGAASNFFCNGPIINTAHKANLQYFSEWTIHYNSCFLLRNPVDLVISRTFRKSEYKEYLHPEGISNKEYLNENIRKTERFYNSALRFPYDEKIKFEDIIENNERFHKSLANIIGGRVDLEKLPFLVEQSINNGKKTNKHSGAKEEIPKEYIRMSKTNLKNVVLKAGYNY
ncbi:hypothetical protein KG088_04690 [Halomonas sp. TRM85114]|uniref:hypothetical protein n=1 Tax=Halomonas jincaotanensis TaxID=2810616 RepID=UPI001BD371E3|nr:hypothetical protein [Halomonas jincaotanensis]MBS9402919.1 hypothetical protein [Halomonas jincaotanensis]